jgi:hypothetical protein
MRDYESDLLACLMLFGAALKKSFWLGMSV